MVQGVLEFAAKQAAKGRMVALVTVMETWGSSPASPGQMMAVLADGTAEGTVGGGASEHKLAQRAVEAVANGERVFSFSFDHAEDGMTCGGGMSGFGNVLGADARLVVFGGGHVAQCLAPLAAGAGFAVTVVEDREEFAPYFGDAEYILCRPDEYVEKISVSPKDFAVVCTRGHQTDGDALLFCLGQPFCYVGMIGSGKKVAALFERLRGEGIQDEVLEKIYAPIGLDLSDGSPQQIAVAILAEMLLVKNGGSLAHRRDKNHA